MTQKPILAFVSTRFLFPADSGGKIRTTQILRGLKGGAFRIRLLMPCNADLRKRHEMEIDSVCDELIFWEHEEEHKSRKLLKKIAWAFGRVPIPVRSDWDKVARQKIDQEIRRDTDVVVFDFPHSAILAPDEIQCPSVMFTHNVEAEIFKRHWQVARSPVHKWLWRNQYLKMLEFEKQVLRSFDCSIAVSDRDCEFFRVEYGVENCRSIPTGVDTEYFEYRQPADRLQVVFCGSMDWMANIDGIEFFYDGVWPLIKAREPEARMKVVGRRPPESLVRRICRKSQEWEFTGFVDDVRDHVSGAGAFVIPLRVGGGTRIKAFEAMAMGCPVVSTSIGVEGLPVEDGVHYLNGDSVEELARSVVSLLSDEAKRLTISESARRLVDSRFGFRKAAAVFEDVCLQAANQRHS